MKWKRSNPLGRFTLLEQIEIDAPVERVFARWSRYEDFPRVMESVRRTKCIDPTCVLWDIELAGRQVVWEARIVEVTPEKRIRWKSTWGTPNQGLVRFEALAEDRTLLCVEIEFEPRGPIERLGARLGLVDFHVRRDLDRFRNAVERTRDETAPEPKSRHETRMRRVG